MARPVQFKHEDVLDSAMQIFWKQGYAATSVTDLIAATKLKPGSLYAAFKSKEGLFLAALDHYGERSAERIRQTLANADSPLAGIRGYFHQMARSAADSTAQHSCFLVNTALELARNDEVVREHVNRYFDRIENLFLDALVAARKNGELAPEKDPAALATFLMSGIWGLRVLEGTHPTQERAAVVVEQLLQQLE